MALKLNHSLSIIEWKTEPFLFNSKKRVIYFPKDGNLASELPIPVEDIVTPDNIISNDGRVMRGSNPWHGSRSGNNFHINLTDNVWYCHRCKSGGSWVEALAVQLGVLDCSDCQPGCLQGEEFKEVLGLAKPVIQKMGYSLPATQPKVTNVEIIKDRQSLDNYRKNCRKMLASFSQLLHVMVRAILQQSYWRNRVASIQLDATPYWSMRLKSIQN